jgi:hypothetical protein
MASPFAGLFTPKTTAAPIANKPFSNLFPTTPTPAPAPTGTARASTTLDVHDVASSGSIPSTALKGSLGGGYGASNITDKYSGKPLLTYENEAAKSNQLLKDRVAPTFDPTIPTKIDASVLHNGRMPQAASEAVRKATGTEPDEQLDHLISLELGGSNDTLNLNLEKTKGGVQPSLPLENQTARDVASGKISYIDGQKIIARAKGVQLPDDAQFASSDHPLASAYPKPNSPPPPAKPGFFGVMKAGIGAINDKVTSINKSADKLLTDIAANSPLAKLAVAVKQKGLQGAKEQLAKEASDFVQKLKEPGGVVSMTAGFAGESEGNIFDQIAASRNPEEIASILRAQPGIEEEAIPALSKTLATKNSPKEVYQTIGEHKFKDMEMPKVPLDVKNAPTVHTDERAQNEAAAKTIAGKGRGANQLDDESKQIYQDWVNQKGNSNKAISGRIASKPFEDLRGQGMDAVRAFQKGNRTGALADVEKWSNELLDKEQKARLPLEKRANYLPQYWANSQAEVDRALQRFSGEDVGKSITTRPGFTQHASFPSYEVGMKYGLTPKYDNIPDMINARVRDSENALADRGFLENLARHNLVQPSGSVKGKGWKTLHPDKFPHVPIRTAGGKIYHGTLSAPAPMADLINNQLRGAQSGADRLFAGTAKWASKLKNIVLSAGVPGTAINLHGFNELAGTVPELLNQPSLFTSALKYLFVPSRGGKFVEENLAMAQQAARSGLTLGVEDHGFDLMGNTKIEQTAWEKTKGILQKGQDTLYSLFARHDFEQMIPALKLQMWRDLKETLVEKGYSAAEAGKLAAEKSNNTFGGINYDMLGRDKNLQNVIRSFVFAPDFWESRLRYAASIGKSFYSSSDPLVTTYRKAAATIIGSYVGMNLWNKEQTGHFMFQNPPGHQMDIKIGTDSKGKDIWLRPFGTDLDFVRLPLDIAASIKQGNSQPLTSLLRNRVSTLLQPIISGVGNVDAYGNPIFGPSTQTNPASKQWGNFAAQSFPVVPQIAAGAAALRDPSKSKAQDIAQMTSLPLRFNAPATSATDSSIADMIYTDRPQLESQSKKDYLTGNTQDSIKQMATFNQALLKATIQAYKDHGYHVTDEKAFTQFLATTPQAKGGLKDLFLKPPSDKVLNNAKARQGKPLFNKIFPSTIH